MTIDRVANLDVVVRGIAGALSARDWAAVERLSERARSVVLDAALCNDRGALDRMREKLGALRSFATARLDASDPTQAMVVGMLRADAGMAVVATRLRPTALDRSAAGREDQSAIDKVRGFLAGRKEATTSEIEQATGLVQTTVSKLLTSLKAQGQATSRRAGKFVHTRLTPRGLAAAGQRPVEPRAHRLRNRMRIRPETVHMLMSDMTAHLRSIEASAPSFAEVRAANLRVKPGLFDEHGPGLSALGPDVVLADETPRRAA